MQANEKQGNDGSPSTPWGGRVAIILLLGALLALSYLVLSDFLVPLLWASVLCYITWPLNRKLRELSRQRRSLTALVMTLVLALVILVPLIGVAVSLRTELGTLLENLRKIVEAGPAGFPQWIKDLPWIGPQILEWVDRVSVRPEIIGEWVAQRSTMLVGEAAGVLNVLGRNAAKFGLALVAAFFIYRDGDDFVAEARSALSCLLGPRSSAYWSSAADVTRGVVYGLVLTAMAQGIVAGVGYWIFGVNAPVLLGALTVLFALIPFGAPVVWGGVSLWLLWQGDLFSAIGMFLWGTVAVSLIDNVVRPLVISASADISFLLVLIGVVGGLKAFGLVGLFLGPVILSVLVSVWRHWIEEGQAGCTVAIFKSLNDTGNSQ